MKELEPKGYFRNFISAYGWDIPGISSRTGYASRVVAPSNSHHSKFPTAMASIRSLPKALIDDTLLSPPPTEITTAAAARKKLLQQPSPNLLPLPISRRDALLISVLPLNLTALSLPSQARERRGRKAISPEEFMTSPDGLKYYDITEGKGPKADKGSTVQVHFDCIYRGITAVSSRESKLLAGNRIIAQPYEFTVGSPPGKERKREFVDNANGLYSAQAAPKPPPAMYSITEGMKVGGKRVVIVPPEAGYGKKGMNEIPPGATFELDVELLEVMPPNGK